MKLPKIDTEARTISQLPPEYLAGIGDVITQWANIETTMRTILAKAGAVDQKVARLTMRDFRPEQFPKTVRLLLALKKVHFRSSWGTLAEDLKLFKEKRDGLAHGVWVIHPTQQMPLLRVLKGNHMGPDAPGAPRVFAPELQSCEPETLHHLAELMRQAGEHLFRIERELTERVNGGPAVKTQRGKRVKGKKRAS